MIDSSRRCDWMMERDNERPLRKVRAMTADTRIDLRVPYVEKDQAKVHGARWDRDNQTWYAPPGTDLENLKRWLPKGVLDETPDPDPTSPKESREGHRPHRTPGRVKGVIDEGFPTPSGSVPRSASYVARTDTSISH